MPVDVQVAHLDGDGRLRLCLKLAILINDSTSLYLFFEDWRRFYEEPAHSPPPLRFSYRDYALFEHDLPRQPAFERAKAYWLKRLDDLPAAPDLPLAMQPGELTERRIVRREGELDRPLWDALKELGER